jgi:hypothetical protein
VIDDPFEELDGGNELMLELDLPNAPKPQAREPAEPVAPPPAGPTSERGLPVAAAPSPGSGPIPTPRSAPLIEAEIDREQASAIAAYGPAPRYIWETPAYAWRVRSRQGELRRELDARRSEAELAKNALDDALVAFAERIRPVAERIPTYAAPLAQATALEQQVRAMDGTAAAETDAHKARMRDVDVKVAHAEQGLSQVQVEERGRADDLAQAEASVQRAQARVKRLDIEMRHEAGAVAAAGGAAGAPAPSAAGSSGRFAAAGQAPDSGKLPADLAGRMREREERLAEIAKAEPAVQSARARLDEARARVAQAQSAVNAAKAERTAHEQLFQRQAGARSAVTGEQRKQLRAHLSAVARRALEDREAFGAEYDPARDDIARCARDADARRHALGLHEQALQAFDASAVTRGYVVVGVAAFVLFVVIPGILLALPWLIHSD